MKVSTEWVIPVKELIWRMLSGSSSDDGSSREEQKIAKVESRRKTNTIWQQCTYVILLTWKLIPMINKRFWSNLLETRTFRALHLIVQGFDLIINNIKSYISHINLDI